MKRLIVPFLISALAFGCLIFLDQSCRADAELSKAKAAAAEAKRIDEADAKRRDALEAGQAQTIAEGSKKIAELLANAGKPTPAEKEKDREIVALKGEVATLKAQGDTAGALAKAEATIAALESKAELAEDRHKANIMDLNAEWQAKFNALQAIADARLTTIGVKDERIAALENEVSKYARKKRLILNLFGLKIDLVNDVIKPGAAFAAGHFTGR